MLRQSADADGDLEEAASVAVVVSATAHTLSGGGAPPAWLLVAVALLATPVAVALVGDRPRPLRLGVGRRPDADRRDRTEAGDDHPFESRNHVLSF